MNLTASRWAPRNWRGQEGTSGLGLGISRTAAEHKPDIELFKHKKLLARLKWKSHLLALSHQRVTQAMQAPTPESNIPSAAEAETMFKLDFFEYYVLLERVILHLLGVFKISVSPDFLKGPPDHSDASRISATSEILTDGTAIIGSSAYDRTYYSHRFHANVLQALDRPSNPLHTVLGTGAVREYLGIAKESRNRWKDAEKEQGQEVDDTAVPGSGALKHQRMLKNVDLEVMLACILEALHKGRDIAEEHVKSRMQEMNGTLDPTDVQGAVMEYNMEDAPLEATADAMEWEEFG